MKEPRQQHPDNIIITLSQSHPQTAWKLTDPLDRAIFTDCYVGDSTSFPYSRLGTANEKNKSPSAKNAEI